MSRLGAVVFVLAVSVQAGLAELVLDKFPASFVFGVSSSAFPTEGASRDEGKGPSIWDEFAKNNPSLGDSSVASDGYHKTREDVQRIKDLGVSHYKFSLSWPRLLPNGTLDHINEAGFTHYNQLIDLLLAANVQPFVTLHHWDLPQALQERGGWAVDDSVGWFKDYAELCFTRFGSKVKLWTTIDDPVTLAYKGYETGAHAPGIKQPGLLYKVGHNLLLAHAAAYTLYKTTFKATQNGQVGIALHSDWFVQNSTSVADVTAAQRALTFQLGWFLEPLTKGDYPTLMKERVALKRSAQGFPDHKMQEFTLDERIKIQGAMDFVGISYSSVYLVSESLSTSTVPGFYQDQELVLQVDTSYPSLEYRPETNPASERRLMGSHLKDLLTTLTSSYNNPPIYVTHSGLGSCGTLKDQHRIEYIREYSNYVLQAIQAGSDVRGYFVWSLVDGWDWERGTSSKTGLYYVDMGQADRPRFPRSSAAFYRALVKARGLDQELRSYRACKGPSIWDTFAHNNKLASGQTGDVACDSYHLYQEDVAMLKTLGVDFYRFSIAWSRVLPDGRAGSLNQNGVDYYNRLIDALLANNIKPMVTLYHWDLPQALQDQGGFMNDSIVSLFEDYARVCFEQFGDRVSHWITFNEAYVISWLGYGVAVFAPGVYDPGFGTYRVAHNIIRSHSRAYHLYKDHFKAKYGGSVGITLDIEWKEPLTDSLDDVLAADRAIEFKLGWFGNAIYGGSGDYPAVMKQYIAEKSSRQGLNTSRLPEFTAAERSLNKGAYDFLGMNHYTSNLVSDRTRANSEPNYEQDQDIETRADPCWPGTEADWLKVNPWGVRNILRWAKEHFNNPPIYITESGRPSQDVLGDTDRIYYYKYYINELLKAIRLDNVDLRGYTAWSLMDNLEWTSGYYSKFGLYSVDFDSVNRTRTPRDSAKFYSQLIQDNGFPRP
ncbi:lactase/phlorizin hydrolase-like isoform X2 [Physella acuta]|uniref:lactase/phlorizin hydrolase-like isoform X2 n=1 Tax=Physella acuta TaxID=109671 RepID=UPI0027DB2334|nr:lactase/phlorizin hydrolase-like isoform X2 [Physella acuta]